MLSGGDTRQREDRLGICPPSSAAHRQRVNLFRESFAKCEFVSINRLPSRAISRSSWTALWFDRPPHRLTREDVREYLLFLVDAGASSAWVGVNLSAIRTAFDKMCNREVTFGLVTPRRPKKLPIVLCFIFSYLFQQFKPCNQASSRPHGLIAIVRCE